MYRDAIYFCIDFYPATLLNLLSCNSFFLFLCGIFRVFYNKIITSVNRDDFISLFYLDTIYLFICLFIYLTYPSAIVRTSTILNVSDESGHLCLILDFRRKASVFHHRVWFCYKFFIYDFYLLKQFLSIPSLLNFWIKGCWILSNAFFLHQLRWSFISF